MHPARDPGDKNCVELGQGFGSPSLIIIGYMRRHRIADVINVKHKSTIRPSYFWTLDNVTCRQTTGSTLTLTLVFEAA